MEIRAAHDRTNYGAQGSHSPENVGVLSTFTAQLGSHARTDFTLGLVCEGHWYANIHCSAGQFVQDDRLYSRLGYYPSYKIQPDLVGDSINMQLNYLSTLLPRVLFLSGITREASINY